MEISEPGKSKANRRGSFYMTHGMLLLVNIMTIAGVVLVAVTLTKVSKLSDEPVAETSVLSEDEVRAKFPGYFRTPEEQKEFEKLHKSFGGYKTVSNDSLLSFNNANQYHGCCNTTEGFYSPPWMVDTKGKNRTLAAFGELRQYFLHDTCTHIEPCSVNCVCTQDKVPVQGVFVNDRRKCIFGIAWFKIPGCCKCMNV